MSQPSMSQPDVPSPTADDVGDQPDVFRFPAGSYDDQPAVPQPSEDARDGDDAGSDPATSDADDRPADSHPAVDNLDDLEVPDAPTTACKDALMLAAAGGYKSHGHEFVALPETTLYSGADAAKRLIVLKQRINELQSLRATQRKKQAAAGAAAAAGAGAAVVSLGAAAVAAGAAGAAGLHVRARVARTKNAIVQCLVQVTAIRARFGELEAVARAESEVRIVESVFGADIRREVLPGDL